MNCPKSSEMYQYFCSNKVCRILVKELRNNPLYFKADIERSQSLKSQYHWACIWFQYQVKYKLLGAHVLQGQGSCNNVELKKIFFDRFTVSIPFVMTVRCTVPELQVWMRGFLRWLFEDKIK